MSTASQSWSEPQRRALFSADSWPARAVLVIFQIMLTSISSLLATAPLIVFELLVGWQPTHLAIALFSLSLACVVPALGGLLAGSAEILDHGSDAQGLRAFWRGARDAAAGLWAAVLFVPAMGVLISYDAALLPDDTAMTVIMVATALGTAMLVTALCIEHAMRPGREGLAQLASALRALGQRPHVVLTGLILVASPALFWMLPVIGPTSVLFTPALAGIAAHVCSRAFDPSGPHAPKELRR
ncbi:MAG TPA: hypothetical protein H9786_12435 [Candidatus Brachybacterium merdavium]|uniref:Uncharacterized protein n=1 Tax=Candidatus Brachybacterium merdavium TaxID=2838513 RepID=A0A9D2LF26_9MICO|nr:hypothetical protein [Candidatus Brachybacterium merdavium]